MRQETMASELMTKNEKAVKNERQHAIVIGASVGGLLAARVLADFFEQVTILERDALPDGAEPRPGVPQSKHLHGLLPRGRRILEKYFPGITSELEAAGAEMLDFANDAAWLTAYGWGVRFPSEFEALSCTRDLLDSILRSRVKRLPNVQILPACDVLGLVGDQKRVEGVKLRLRRAGESLGSEILPGNFVVAATGRNSTVTAWLKELGYAEPEVDSVNAHIGYASRTFRRPDDFRGDWRAIIVQSAPPSKKRGGILFPIEKNRWLVTLQGADRDYPPTDASSFLEFARGLRSPLLYEAIRGAEALSPISSYRATENRLRHYELLKTWPDYFVVLGDAGCAFNPVYGQGMTMAALGAETLRTSLKGKRTLDGIARRFQKRLAQINRAPWTLATSVDQRFTSCEGPKANWNTRFMQNYVAWVLKAATRSSSVRRRFLEVQGMLKGPGTLFRPAVVLQVLREILGERFRSLGNHRFRPVQPVAGTGSSD
jgi:2-polyprenyl-6-methoxyphenol hydroxylase-like FAD-dependent oxidoreductase